MIKRNSTEMLGFAFICFIDDGNSYEYNLTDHLGNVRYTFNQHPTTLQLQALQADDYYPFGKRLASGGFNKYLYNGKELQEELG